MHVHVSCSWGEAKFWLEPELELAMSRGLKEHEWKKLEKILKARQDEVREEWRRHFGS